MATSVDSVVLELEARLGQYNADVAGAANTTERALKRIDTAATQTEKSFGSTRMGMQQLSYQLGDVAQQFALGVRPMTIFVQQGGQVLQAVQMMNGGTSKLASFLGGPWGIAVMAAGQVLIPLIGGLTDAAKASELAEEGANGLASAQSSLGEIFDLTTGRIKSQNEVLLINARLMAANLRAEALTKRASARETLENAVSPRGRSGAVGFAEAQTIGIQGLPPTTGEANAAALRKLLLDIGAGRIARAEAIHKSETMDFTGTGANRAQFQGALRDAVVANLNDRAARLIDQSLASGQLAPALRQPGAQRHGGHARPERKGRTSKSEGPSAEDIEAKFDDQLIGITQQILHSREQRAASADERAELEARGVEWTRRQALADVDTNKQYNNAQKEELRAAITRRADAELEVIHFRARQQREREAQELADERHEAERDALRNQYDLATTESQRRDLALRILAAEDAYLQSKLQAVINAHTINGIQDQQAKVAQAQLEALNNTAADRQEIVRLQHRGALGRYADSMSDPEQQVQDAVAKKLQAVNDGITDAITEKFGIKDQFIKDLFSIFLEQNIFRPLADAMAGGGGGGVGGFFGTVLGSIFGGFRASGGPVSPGRAYAVNERSTAPGLFIPVRAGSIIADNRISAANSPTVVNQTFVLDARHGITTPQLLDHVNQVAQSAAVQVGSAIGQGVLKRVPARMAGYQRDGT